MKQVLLDFYRRLGINPSAANELESVTLGLIVGLIAFILWLIGKRVFGLIFQIFQKEQNQNLMIISSKKDSGDNIPIPPTIPSNWLSPKVSQYLSPYKTASNVCFRHFGCHIHHIISQKVIEYNQRLSQNIE